MRHYAITVFLALIISQSGYAEQVDGSMKCRILETSVLQVIEGKAKTYSGIDNKVSKGDTFVFEYKFFGAKEVGETNTTNILAFYFSEIHEKILFKPSPIVFDLRGMDSFNLSSNLAVIKGDKRSASFGPNYIRVDSGYGEEIRLRRYFKDDWHGSFVNFEGLMVETHVFECKPTAAKVSQLLEGLKKAAFELGRTIE